MNMNRKLNRIVGFSLIELLITMVIGLFLLSGIASTYLASKKMSMKQEQHSSLEDNGRIAIEVITQAIEHAGYAPMPAKAGTSLLPSFINTVADVTVEACGADQNVVNSGIFTANRVTGDFAVGDSIGVIYYGDSSIFTDCGGNVLPNTCKLNQVPVTNTFSEAARIYNSFFVDAATTSLMCSGSRTPAPVVIAQGVESVQYLYGVDTDGDGAVNRYENATNVTSWVNVISVQVAILVRSLRPVKRVPISRQYTLLDSVIRAPLAGTDRFERAVFSTTIHLRNTL